MPDMSNRAIKRAKALKSWGMAEYRRRCAELNAVVPDEVGVSFDMRPLFLKWKARNDRMLERGYTQLEIDKSVRMFA